MTKRAFAALLEWLPLLTIVLLAAGLRLVNLADNPAWYTDEATHLDIARSLAGGRVQYMAIGESVLLFARPPLFHGALALLFNMFGASLLTLRTFTALVGVVTVLLTYAAGRITGGGRGLALLAALCLATYPNAVIYHRFGFSYNLLTLFVLAAFIGGWHYATTGQRRSLALALLCVGLGVLVDIPGSAYAAPLLTLVLFKRPRDMLWAVPLLGVPIASYALVMLLTVPDAFWFDLNFTLGRLGGMSLVEQTVNIVRNITMLVGGDAWLLLGMIGVFLLRPLSLRVVCLLFLLLPIAVMGRTAALYSLSFYYALPLLPFFALGMAGFALAAVRHVRGLLRDSDALLRVGAVNFAPLVTAALLGLMLAAPFVYVLAQTVSGVQTRLPTAIDPFLIAPVDAQTAATLINACTTAEDLVLASPSVAVLLDARAVDFQFAVSITGEDAVHLPGSTPRERYLFDTRLETARYVVVDNLWRNWGAVHIPGALRILQGVEADWRLVLRSGALEVYANPAQFMSSVNNSTSINDPCFSSQN